MQFDDDQEIAVKCDMCVVRQKEGKGPACAAICPTGCIFWGGLPGPLQKAEQRGFAKKIRRIAIAEIFVPSTMISSRI
jgi:Fe-S-cluster-containing dehydrogenase component